jgi:hypothetical protein
MLDLANRIDRGESLEGSAVRAIDQRSPGQARRASRPHRARAGSAVTASPTAALRVSVQRVDELFRVSGEVSSAHGGDGRRDSRR